MCSDAHGTDSNYKQIYDDENQQILMLRHRKETHPVEVSLGKSHVFALSVWVLVQDVLVVKQQHFRSVFTVAFLATSPQSSKRSASTCREGTKAKVYPPELRTRTLKLHS